MHITHKDGQYQKTHTFNFKNFKSLGLDSHLDSNISENDKQRSSKKNT